MTEDTLLETPNSGEEGSPSPESQPDLQAMLGDISSELFGQVKEEAGEQEGEVESQKEGSEAVTPTESSLESPSPPVQVPPPPSSLSKEAKEAWESFPELARAELLKREEDIFRGIEEYKARAEIGDSFSSVMKPYQEILQSQQIDPLQLVQGFAGNHYLLTYGTPEQKVQLAANMMQHYGIDLNQVAGSIANYKAPDPEIQALKQELSSLKSTLNSQQEAQLDATKSEIEAEITAFAANSPYFEELATDIAKFLSVDSSMSLSDAYDKALWANPSTRAKEIARLDSERAEAAKEAERQEKKAKSNGADLSVRSHSRQGTTPVGTIDDTLQETLAAIKSRS